jgi:hypothetical protein
MTTARRLGLLLLLIACAPLLMALSGSTSGRAYRDLNNNGVRDDPGEPGLVGWTIHVFHTATKALLQSTLTMPDGPGPPPTGDGFYFFVLDPGNYTFCVALQDGWTQTAPVLAPPPPGATPADCTSYTNGGAIELAPRGYDITITGTEVRANLDFGLAFGSVLTGLDDVQLWVGLKSSDDQGTLFDVKVELLKNGDSVASGLRRCVTGLTRNPSLASGVSVAWDNFTSVSLAPTDVLALRVSTRIGTNRDDTKCVTGPASAHASARGLRLYYDAASRPAGFDATLAPGSNHSLYLDSNGTACPAGGADSPHVTDWTLTGPAPIALDAKCKDSSAIKFIGGNVFSEVGTWTLP